MTRVPAMPPRSVDSARTSQSRTGSRSSTSRTASRSAPASMRAPRAMSPAMPEKQWNQATVRGASGMTRPRPEYAGHGHGRTEAVVDADDAESGGARREHAEEGGDAFESRPV